LYALMIEIAVLFFLRYWRRPVMSPGVLMEQLWEISLMPPEICNSLLLS
jgi:hypothetical protein